LGFDKGGFAIPFVMLALLVAGALATVATLVAVQEIKLSDNTVALEQALAAAEGGADLVALGWGADECALVVGDSLARAGALGPGGGWYRASVRRLNETLFLVRAEGFSADSAARREVGLLVRLRDSAGATGVSRLRGRSWIYPY